MPTCRWRSRPSSPAPRTSSTSPSTTSNSSPPSTAPWRATAEEDRRRAQEDLSHRLERLTPREVEIFDFVVQGYTSHAIGEKLAISIRTVESHRAQIMEKMQAESVAVLVRQAITSAASSRRTLRRSYGLSGTDSRFLPPVLAFCR